MCTHQTGNALLSAGSAAYVIGGPFSTSSLNPVQCCCHAPLARVHVAHNTCWPDQRFHHEPFALKTAASLTIHLKTCRMLLLRRSRKPGHPGAGVLHHIRFWRLGHQHRAAGKGQQCQVPTPPKTKHS